MAVIDFSADHFGDALKVGKDLVICKSQHQIPLAQEHAVANGVVLSLIWKTMLTAVELDDKLCTMLGEVEKISFEWYLPPKVAAVLI
jgi:hypothetical protein